MDGSNGTDLQSTSSKYRWPIDEESTVDEVDTITAHPHAGRRAQCECIAHLMRRIRRLRKREMHSGACLCAPIVLSNLLSSTMTVQHKRVQMRSTTSRS